MLSLVWKDIYTSRLELILAAILLCVFAASGFMGKSFAAFQGYVASLVLAYSGVIVPCFAISSAMIEEKNRTLALIRSLPIRADAIVASKFIGALLVGALWVGGTALAALIVGSRMADSIAVSAVSGLLWMCATLPAAAVELVAFFRSGAKTARIAALVIWPAVGLILLTAVFRGFGERRLPAFVMILDPAYDLAPRAIALVVAGALLIYLAGMATAQAIFQRREL